MQGDPSFEWDEAKDRANRAKHGVSFAHAQEAFFDPRRVIAEDLEHGNTERRYFCFGKVGARRHDSAFHLAQRPHPHFWRRLLAERKDDL
jgi:uncharacterized DUF497 family protein